MCRVHSRDYLAYQKFKMKDSWDREAIESSGFADLETGLFGPAVASPPLTTPQGNRQRPSLAPAALLAASALPASADALPDRITALLAVACEAPYSDPQRFRSALGDIKIISHTVNTMGDAPGRAKTVLIDEDGSEIQISTLFPAGRLRRIGIEISDPAPRLSVNADHMCRVTEVRDIVYTPQGIADVVRVLSADMQTTISEEPLNPPVPIGKDPAGITVGVIDSGIDYTVAPFQDHLARDSDGKLIGRDLWDMDDRPFDVDTSRSPFFPQPHSSIRTCCSYFLRAITVAILIRYRCIQRRWTCQIPSS